MFSRPVKSNNLQAPVVADAAGISTTAIAPSASSGLMRRILSIHVNSDLINTKTTTTL